MNDKDSIATVNEEVRAPTTESQLEVWMSSFLGGDDASRAYNFSVSLTLHGKLDKALFEKSLQYLVDRHESLRSVISPDGTEVIISEHAALELNFQDLSTLEEKTKVLENVIKNDINHPFDLPTGPLYKLSLFMLEEGKHVLVFTAHHVICDGWSMGLFMEELGKVYSAYTNHKEPALSPAVSFHKYATEQEKFIHSQEYHDIETFWLNQFQDNVPVLDIPTDYDRPSVRTTKSNRIDYVFNPELLAGIQQLSNQLKCSLAITLRAVFEILLYRVSGQDDIVLGLPAAGQPATGNYNLISHCINLLPLRSKLNEKLSFKEYVTERKFATLDAYDNQRFTFGSLLKKLNIPRDPARVPLVSAVFSFDLGLGENIQFEGLQYDLITNRREYENFEIFVNVTNEASSLGLQCTYNTQLFSADSMNTMMANFESLVELIVNDPEVRVKDVVLSNTDEIYSKLSLWNSTFATYPNSSINKLITQNASNYPGKTAITFRNDRLTYEMLNKRSNRLATYLLANGVNRGDRIAVALDRTHEMVIVLLGILKSGAAYVPADPGFPKKRIEYMLTDSSAKLLITSANYKGEFTSNSIREIILEDIEEELLALPATEPNINIEWNDLAYIIYTSGTTGKPKGIAIEHKSLTNFLWSMKKTPGIVADDKLLAVTTISFDISGLELFLPLISGAELVLADTETAMDGRELLDLLRKGDISIMQATPSTWRMIIDAGWNEKLSLKVLCGGEALARDLAADLYQRSTELWNMYGPTETTIWSAVKLIKDPYDIITIGRPINNTEIYILDQDLRPVPQGSIGEICIAGDGLAREYFNKPELTDESFIGNPFTAEKKIYRTGDLGKFTSDGEIQCFGRKDYQLKVRGYRIEPGAIETNLNSFDDIKDSVVIAREDHPGDQRLVAYIVPVEPEISALSEDSEFFVLPAEKTSNWKRSLKDILPAYMVPGDYVGLKRIPLLPNGKIDRKSLPKPTDLHGSKEKIQLPESEFEKTLAAIWADLLQAPSIGLYDDFFELGGHSLIAVQMMIRLEKQTGKSLPLTALFRFPVLKHFAELVEKGLPEERINAPVQAQTTAGKTTQDPTKRTYEGTDLEQLVVSILKEHLKLDHVGLDDNFFELGGHSMIAVRVMAKIEKETGQRLPLASLFEHDTARGLASLLKSGPKATSWDSLVSIKPSGTKMPLYIVHGAGLNVLPFDTLAKNMDEDQPVYGLQAKGLNGIDDPLEKIEDMAAHYIEEILQQNPTGPYALAGFSFGGIIAFDMAKLLKTMGKEVKVLAIFDSNVEQSDRYDPLFIKLFSRSKFFANQVFYSFRLLKDNPMRTIQYKSESLKRHFLSFFWKYWYGENTNLQGFYGYSHAVDMKNLQAADKYVLTPYNGVIDLFRAKKRLFYVNDFEYLGWKPYALKGVRIHEIPGEHNYIFDYPNVPEFAASLQRCLNNAVK